MRLDIKAGILWIHDKPENEDKLAAFCKQFGEWAEVDFCVDESDEVSACLVGTYDKTFTTVEQMRKDYKYFKKNVYKQAAV